MGASKQMVIEGLDRDAARARILEGVGKGDEWVEELVEELITLQSKNRELFLYHQNLAQILLMVTHVIRSYGFCNPDVQVARLDPDNIGDGSRIINEAFSVVETPYLGRNVSHLVEHALRGKYDELAKRLGWGGGEGAEKSGK